MTLFFINQSRLATIQKPDLFVLFSIGSKTGPFVNQTRIESDKTGRSGFRMLTVLIFFSSVAIHKLLSFNYNFNLHHLGCNFL
jgi:hypothetical protein